MDVAIPEEADGFHAASADMLDLALTMLVEQAGGRLVIPANAAVKMTDGTLAFAFTGPEGENLDLAWVRHEAPEAVQQKPFRLPTPEEQERDNIKLGLALLVIEAGGKLRLPPFNPAAIPQGMLTFGTGPDGNLLYTFVPHERN